MILDPKEIARQLERGDQLLQVLTSEHVMAQLMRHPRWRQMVYRCVYDEQRRLKKAKGLDPDQAMRMMNGIGGV